jgi:DnaJ-domain-containing protein 1
VLEWWLQAQQRIMKVLGEELLSWMDELLRDSLTPEAFARYMAGLGAERPDMAARNDGSDPYQVLGLEKTASDAEIKKRFRELLFKHHPDTAGAHGNEPELRKVIDAYGQIEKERGWR